MATLIRQNRLRPGADLLQLVMADRALLNEVGDMLPPEDAGFIDPWQAGHSSGRGQRSLPD